MALSDPLIDRVVDLRGSGQVQTLEVWEATIYAASECQAAPAASPPVPFPGSVWWDEFDCLITDTTTSGSNRIRYRFTHSSSRT